MRDVLKTRIPDGDFDAQTVLGDLVVDGHAVIYADLRAQIETLRVRQSLRDLQRAPAGPDTDDATDAVLANLVIARDRGTFARGNATVHLTRRVDTLIPRNCRFFKTRSLVFYLNTQTDLLVPASSLRPAYDAQGTITTWAYDVPLIAARTGAEYNVPDGRFQGVDPFSPYVSHVTSSAEFAGGLDVETATSAISRVPTALSLRAMVNDRSFDARIREAFPEVGEVLTVGAGDPEMARDRVPGRTNVHVLGHADTYVRLPLRAFTYRGTIGAAAPRADGRVLTFEETAPPSGSFLVAGVREGDVLVVAAGLPEAPAHFRIAAVRANALDVVPTLPFSRATNELSPPPSLTYSIGDNYPLFDNHASARTSSTASTSRAIRRDGCVVLPAGPVYAVRSVEIPSPPSALSAFVDIASGTAYYTSRRSTSWARAPRPGEPLSYRVLVDNPVEGQSSRAVTLIELGWPGETLAGTAVLVTYESLVGFDAVAQLVEGRSERVLAANVLTRGHHPVYVTCTVPYRPHTSRTAQGFVAQEVDEVKVAQAVASYIEAAPPEGLDAGSLGGIAQAADPNIRMTFPFELTYTLILPDGRVAEYASTEAVEIAPGDTSGARLINHTELGLPSDYKPSLRRLLSELGVSDRVVRYRATASTISLERR